jgi:hypothetical protein
MFLIYAISAIVGLFALYLIVTAAFEIGEGR